MEDRMKNVEHKVDVDRDYFLCRITALESRVAADSFDARLRFISIVASIIAILITYGLTR